MRDPEDPATWSETFAWLRANNFQILIGSVFGVMVLMAFTSILAWGFGTVIQPHFLGLVMTLYYAVLSSYVGLKQETLIKESICYYIATLVIIFFGIGFEIPTN